MKQIISLIGTETKLGGMTVPATGGVDVSDENLRHMRLHDAHFRAQLAAGAIAVVDAEPEPEPEPEFTRETVAKMKRADLLDLLEAHGIAEDELEGKYVDELRALAVQVVFVDL